MANRYINKFYDPSDTTQVSLYTAPSDARAIIQNIQIANESGSKTVKIFITDFSATTTYQVGYASITGPTTCNMAKGPLILEGGDSILIQTTDTAGISATISILEYDRT